MGADAKIACAAILLALALVPAGALAAPRVVMGPIRGDAKGALARQLAAGLCGPLECVRRSSAYRGTRPDFAKARREGVAGIVFGAVTGTRGQRLWLALLTTSTEPRRTWKIPIRANGLLPPASVEAIVGEVLGELAPAEPVVPRAAAPPPRAGQPAPAPRVAEPLPPPPPRIAEPLPPPPPLPAPARAPPGLRPAGPAAPPAPSSQPAPVAGTAPQRPSRPPSQARAEPGPAPVRAAIEIGAWVTGRKLGYGGADTPGSATLQTMTANAIACPRIAAEVYPAAWLGRGALAGLGAFADYRRSVGFKVLEGAQEHAATLTRAGAGVIWRLPEVTGLRLGLSPSVSWQRLDLGVSGSVAGLPDAHLQGVKAGLGASLPLGSRWALLAGGGWVRWTKAGDLVRGGTPFFPSGSASAIEAEAGLSVVLSGRFSALVVGEISSTRYSLDVDPTGAYVASSATDRYLGGRASIRVEL